MEEINVHIGEVKTGTSGQVLRALLGSCVGIALLWPERGIFGLAHCLLAKSPEKDFVIGAKYVDQAIHSLLTLMNITKDDYSKVRAVVAGGGNMINYEESDKTKLVGYNNRIFAIEALDRLKIKIVFEDTGGTNGRRISIDCDKGSYDVVRIPRPEVA